MDNDNLKEIRVKFIETGARPEGVRTEILESWTRCRERGLEKRPIQNIILGEKELQEILLKNKDLIEVSITIMESIKKSVTDTPLVLALSDVKQCILKVLGTEDFIQLKKEGLYEEGSRWLEEEVGTNAMKLCTALNRPIQTKGHEHYREEHTIFTCSGVPIHSENGEIIGSLNSINYMNDYTDHTLGMIVAGVNIIEKQIALVNHIQFFEHSLASIHEGVIITNKSHRITYINPSANIILKAGKNQLKDIFIGDILQNFDSIHAKEYLNEKRLFFQVEGQKIPCIGTISLIEFNQELSGISIVFKAEKTVNKSINKMIGNEARYTFENFITQNQEMKNIMAEAIKLSKAECSILITGESGTGKELFAQSIHNESNRREGPFIAINCAALPRNLVESELFGYEEGAFTGAKKNGFVGKFELANGGTIFLDEIGEMPIEIQSKLLRVLDSKKIVRLGGRYEQEIDVRVIAATNKDLEKEVKENSFRLDLYYRLSAVTFELPSLKEKLEDIPLLCNHFLSGLNKKNPKKIYEISPDYIDILKKVTWKGNCRELHNVVARSYYLCEGDMLTADCLPVKMLKNPSEMAKKEKPMEDMEKTLIIKAISENGGNVTRAALSLNISKPTIYRKIKKYDIHIRKNVEFGE